MAWSENPLWTQKYLVTVSAGPLMFMACSYDRRAGRRALVAGVLGAGMAAGYALVQAGGLDPLAERWTTQFAQRPIGTLGNPDYLGGHLLLGFFCALALTVQARSTVGTRGRILIMGAGLLMIPAFILAAVRGSALGLLGGLVILGFYWAFQKSREKIGPRALIATAATVVVFATVLAASPAARSRLSGLFNYQSEGARQRLITYSRTWRLYRHYPWTGVGYGNFPRHYPMLLSEGPHEPYHLTGHVHNEFLRALVEGGPMGAILFVGFAWLWFFLAAWKALGQRFGPLTVAAAGGVALGIHGLFGFPWQISATACFAGALAGWAGFSKKERALISVGLPLGRAMALGALLLAVISARNLLPDAYSRQAKAQWFLGDLARVVENAERVRALDPSRDGNLALLGRAKLAQGSNQAASQAYGEAARLSPGDLRYLFPLGYTLTLQGKFEEAKGVLQEAKQLDPSHQAVKRLYFEVQRQLARD